MADQCAYIHKAFFEPFLLWITAKMLYLFPVILTLVSNFDSKWKVDILD